MPDSPSHIQPLPASSRGQQRNILHVGRPNTGDKSKLLARFADILDSRWLTNDGPVVRELEQKVASLAQVGHAVAMCNATAALQVASMALGLRGEVIVPGYTFIATAHALQWIGIMPIFCDIDAKTHNIDPGKIEKLITSSTTGILGVHLWGRSCDDETIQTISAKHGLAVLYDAAHAFGCTGGGKCVGNFGNCEVFSFHATKFVHSGEGGFAVTNDSRLAEKMRLMRNFGFEGYDRVGCVGINAKMSEFSAAVGLGTLEAMDEIICTNRRNYEAYCVGLADVPGISVIDYDPAERNNYQYVVIEVDPEVCALNRDEIVEALHAENVIARKYFWPGCHKMEPYCSLQQSAGLLLPETDRVAARVISLPTGQAVDLAAVQRVCRIIRDTLVAR